jgi:hypothetical protein
MHPLQPVFERFGRVECAGTSPLYEQLSEVVAADPDLLALAETARPGHPAPNLLFGAVHLLLTRDPRAPLARWYPDLAEAALRHDDPGPAFRAFCLERRGEIVALLGERRVQTNEVQRCLLLLPAFQLVARRAHAPLALVEIGTSAGLLLRYDRYAYEYRGADRRVLEPAGAALRLTTDIEGTLTPPVLPAFPEAGYRVGLDLHPLDARSPVHREWLLALVWPEHADRRHRLAAALDLAAADPPDVRAADATTDLAALLAEVPPQAALVVFHMSVMRQISAAGQAAIDAALRAASRARDLWRVANDLQASNGERLPLTLTRYRRGEREDRLLAEAPGHVRWLRWVDPDAR